MDKQNYKFILVTVATEQNSGYDRYIESIKSIGGNPVVLGYGRKWEGGDMSFPGGGHKVNLLKEHLTILDIDGTGESLKDTIICFTDCYDVLPNKKDDFFDGLVESFLAMDKDIVFGAELFCYPDESLSNFYPNTESVFKYLNSGLFIGYADKIYSLLKSRDLKNEDDDQLYFTKFLLENPERLAVDNHNILFCNLNGALDRIKIVNDTLYVGNGFWTNDPYFIHANGPNNVKNYLNVIQDLVLSYDYKTNTNRRYKTYEEAVVPKQEEKLVHVILEIREYSKRLEDIFNSIASQNYPKDRMNINILISKSLNLEKLELIIETIFTTKNYRHFVISQLETHDDFTNLGKQFFWTNDYNRYYSDVDPIRSPHMDHMIYLTEKCYFTDKNAIRYVINQGHGIFTFPILDYKGKNGYNFEMYPTQFIVENDIMESKYVGRFSVNDIRDFVVINGNHIIGKLVNFNSIKSKVDEICIQPCIINVYNILKGTDNIGQDFNVYNSTPEELKRLNVKNENGLKLVVFYHTFLIEGFEKYLEEQLGLLKDYGLSERVSEVHIGLDGSWTDRIYAMEKYKNHNFYFYNVEGQGEQGTLQLLHNMCRKEEHFLVLYMHTKGITYLNSNNPKYKENLQVWRRYMEYWNIKKAKLCVDLLMKGYDIVGTSFKENPYNHYSGNFWWASSQYLKSLPYINKKDVSLEENRYMAEKWVFINNPNFYSHEKLEYTKDIRETGIDYFEYFEGDDNYIGLCDVKSDESKGEYKSEQSLGIFDYLEIVEGQEKLKRSWVEKYIKKPLYQKEYDLIVNEVFPMSDIITFPAFNKAFCEEVITIAEEKNVWESKRHEYYPAEDVIIDKLGLKQMYSLFLKEFIYPLAKHYWKLDGESWDSLYSEDFINRYRVEAQPKLDIHHDSSIYTVLLTLNEDFEGGGTIFPTKRITHKGKVGDITIHPGLITHKHGGVPISSGTRYVMVSFCKKLKYEKRENGHLDIITYP